MLTKQPRPSGLKHLPSLGSNKIPGIENVKLIWVFHFDHNFTLNYLINLIFSYQIQKKKASIIFVSHNYFNWICVYDFLRDHQN